MHNHSTKNFGNTGENMAASTGADVQSLDRIAACSVCDWIGQINKAWTRGAVGTLELAKVVCAARSQLMYGQWTQLWKSADMPISKRTGEMLVVIGRGLGWVNAKTFAQLPAGWSVVYFLAKLDRKNLERLLQEGVIHPKLTLRQAKELLATFGGRPNKLLKINVKQRLDRFGGFVRDTVSKWEPKERELAAKELSQLIEEIATAGGVAFQRISECGIFTWPCDLPADSRTNQL